MTRDDFPDPFGDRIRWALRESAIVFAIVIFWLALGVGLLLVLGLLQVFARALGFPPVRFLFAFADHGGAAWALLTPVATASTALYVLVRAGTVLIDRYRATG
ncbi:MAG: hypothetical protein ABEH64_07245 [Salinirussus sp.]